jgi:CRISPR-associated protein Cmr4
MQGRYYASDILLITAITNLHVGTGRGGEVVDLPIQRDSYGFPTIYSSSLKGAIKSYIYNNDGQFAEILFGPDGSGEFASPVALTDAYLLAFPSRSLKGVYCYLTCPLLLKRFKEYTDMIGYKLDNDIKSLIEEGKYYICDDLTNISISSDDKKVVVINEELVLENLNEDKKINKLKKILGLDKELIVIKDEDAQQQVERSLIRLTRVKLNRSSKTVQSGPWTEEYVPPKTVFFSTLHYSKLSDSILKKYEKIIGDKIKNKNKMEEEIRAYLKNKLGFLIIGGHETIGSGIVNIHNISLSQTQEGGASSTKL